MLFYTVPLLHSCISVKFLRTQYNEILYGTYQWVPWQYYKSGWGPFIPGAFGCFSFQNSSVSRWKSQVETSRGREIRLPGGRAVQAVMSATWCHPLPSFLWCSMNSSPSPGPTSFLPLPQSHKVCTTDPTYTPFAFGGSPTLHPLA